MLHQIALFVVFSSGVYSNPLSYGAQVEYQNAPDLTTPFALQLFNNILNLEEGSGNSAQNFVYSPLSAIRAFALLKDMTTSDDSRTILGKSLGISQFSDNTINKVTRLIEQITENDPKLAKSEVTMNNRMYLDNSWSTPAASLVKSASKHRSKLVRYEPKEMEVALHSWLGQTASDDFLTNLSKDTHMLLLNDASIKTYWENGFKVKDTHMKNFFIDETTAVEVPMMSRRGEYKYVKTCESDAWNVLDWTDFECTFKVQPDILEVPLGNSSLSMVFVVSNEQFSIEHLTENLAADLNSWRSNAVWSTSEIYLPKFKIEQSTELSVMLEANKFTSVDVMESVKKSARAVYSEFYHKASISIDESGHIPPPKKMSFMDMLFAHLNFQPVILYRKVRVNRPFVFLVEERDTGSIVMMGKITDPTLLH